MVSHIGYPMLACPPKPAPCGGVPWGHSGETQDRHALAILGKPQGGAHTQGVRAPQLHRVHPPCPLSASFPAKALPTWLMPCLLGAAPPQRPSPPVLLSGTKVFHGATAENDRTGMPGVLQGRVVRRCLHQEECKDPRSASPVPSFLLLPAHLPSLTCSVARQQNVPQVSQVKAWEGHEGRSQ